MKKKITKLLSAVLVLATLIGYLPVLAFAEEGNATATAITSLDDLVTGQYVIEAQGTGKAATYKDGTYLLATDITATDGVIADVPADAVVTITKKENGYVLTDSLGNDLAPESGNNTILVSEGYEWTVTFSDGTFMFTGEGSALAYNTSAGKYRAYKNNGGSQKKQLTLYAVSGEPVVPEVPVGAELSTLKVGDTVVLYNPGHEKAISSDTYQNNGEDWYLLAGDVTIEENAAVEPAENLIWTVDVTDGVYTFTQGEKVISAYPSGDYVELSNQSTENTATGWLFAEADADHHIYYMRSSTLDVSDGNAYVRCCYQSRVDGDTFCGNACPEESLTVKDYGMQFYPVTVETPPTPPDPPTDEYATLMTTMPANGDKLLIMHRASNSVMGDVLGEDSKINAVVQAPEDGKVAIQDGMGTLTVVIQEYNSYAFLLDGKYVASKETGNGLTLEDELTDLCKWSFESQEDGSLYLKNSTAAYNGNAQYLEFYNGYTTYGYKANNDAYKFDLYLVEASGEEPPTPPTPPDPPVVDTYATLMSDIPADGDKILLHMRANNLVLGTEANGAKLVGVEQAPEDNKVAVLDGMAVLTAALQEDGSYALMLGETYLTSGATGSSLSYGAELSDLSKWIFEVQENGTYLVKNVGALYDGTKPQYIEYYKGFTTYSYNTNSSSVYEFDLYLVKAAPQLGPVTDLEQLTDGTCVVMYNPANNKALSQVFNGNYLTGVDVNVTADTISGYTNTEVWTVGVTEDGKYTFSTADGKKLSMDTQYSSTPFDKVNDTWTVTEVESVDGNFYIDNVGRSGYRLEWYADKNYWSCYYKNNTGDLFQQRFWAVERPADQPIGETVIENGAEVVVYNASSESVLGQPNDMQISLLPAAATIEGGKAVCANGALVFTVAADATGSEPVYVFETGGKYLAANDAENLFLTETLDDFARWTLTKRGSGYIIYNKAAKYNGTPVCIEFFSGAFSGWTFKAAEPDIFLFNFYPVADGTTVTEGVVNEPVVTIEAPDAFVGKDYTFTVNVDAVFGVEGDLTVTVNGKTYTPDENGVYTVPKEEVTGTELVIAVSGTDTKGVSFSGEKTVPVRDEPVIENISPAQGAETGENKRPEISADVINAGENPTVELKLNDVAVEATYADGRVTYTPSEDMEDGRVNVSLTVTRADNVSTTKTWFFIVGKAQYRLYFGQLHSHTAEYSDGAGTLQQGLDYIKNLPESANVQFVAFTDHSNYFDASSAANPEGALYDMSLATAQSQDKWANYRSTVAQFNEENAGAMVALAGFEMTWSGGPGHINTFNSPGIVSRNNTTLNNKTNDAGLQAYYALLSQAEGADVISQFNHPGKTFGNFIDFSYWNAVIDTRMYLVEVGNGEGQIGAGGYYPSYEQYTMALDKGWHVAPTNNQDNHKGKWGNANDARDVILTDNFTEEGIYAAIQDRRIYATEDKNLELHYTVNDLQLGSIIEEIPEELNLYVSLYDPDKSDSISKVEVIVNSGKTAYTWDDPSELENGELTVTLPADYSYYFIRVTQGDGDLAVTAPVWVGETLKLGISAFESETSTPVTNEELTLDTTLFNSEITEANVTSLTYTINGGEVIGTDTTGYAIPASGTVTAKFKYTPTDARVITITVTAVVEQGGKEFIFTKDLELDVRDADKLVYIGIDASHYNEYVAGNYKDSMGNFGALAAQYDIRTVELKTSEELIAACANEKYVAMIFTAPSRRLAAAQSDPKTYSTDEIAAVKAFNQGGGLVIVAGWSDNYENYSVITGNPSIKHMAETQNELLEALGTSLRLGDDATLDNELNGNQPQRLYFSTYDFDHFLTEGVEVDPENPNNRLYSEVFSQYGGCSVFVDDGTKVPTATVPESVTGVVFGHTTTYIGNQDNDSNTVGILYPFTDGTERVLALAADEKEGQGTIIVSGAAFMSNFEVQATIEDNGSEKNYSNYKICENLLKHLNPVEITPIDDVRKQTEAGYKYTIEGVVTSNASGYDKDTAFFDCIYVQDETGGICCFPVAGNFKIGDKVRVSGTTDFYQGEPELQVTSIEVIGEGEVTPVEVTAKDVNDLTHLGELITVSGTVESFEEVNGLVQTIMVKDANGDTCRVFIDGYITINDEVKNLENGCDIVVTGLSSFDDTFNAPDGPFPRIRIRNRADVICTPKAIPEEIEITDQDTSESIELTWSAVNGAAGYQVYLVGSKDTLLDTVTEAAYSYKPSKKLLMGETYTFKVTAVDADGNEIVSGTDADMYNPFADVEDDRPSFDYIAWAYNNDIVKGSVKEDGNRYFEPEGSTTRMNFVMILYKMHGSPKVSGKNPFKDVSGSKSVKAVLWAYNKGLVKGTDKTHFSPDVNLSRINIIMILYKLAGSPKVSGSNPFTDISGSKTVKAVLWAVKKKIITGVDATHFDPDGDCSRELFVEVLYKYNKIYKILK